MKINKKILLTAIISAVLASTISVAAVSLSAKDIGFKSTNENLKATNVEDAINDLYVIGNDKLPEKYEEGYNAGAASVNGGELVYYQGHSSSAKTINLENGEYIVSGTCGHGTYINEVGSLNVKFNCTSKQVTSSLRETYNDTSYTHRSNFFVHQITVTNGSVTITPTSGNCAYTINSIKSSN